jgi:hypothetical protein
LAVVEELVSIRVGEPGVAEELVAPFAVDGVEALAVGLAGIEAGAEVEPDGSAAVPGGTAAAPAVAAVGLDEAVEAGAGPGASQAGRDEPEAVVVERDGPGVGWVGCQVVPVGLGAGWVGCLAALAGLEARLGGLRVDPVLLPVGLAELVGSAAGCLVHSDETLAELGESRVGRADLAWFRDWDA